MEAAEKQFNTKVHHFDPQTGQLLKHTPYTLICEAGGKRTYIRDGVRYLPNGEPASDDDAQKAAKLPKAVATAPAEAKSAMIDQIVSKVVEKLGPVMEKAVEAKVEAMLGGKEQAPATGKSDDKKGDKGK